MQFISARSHSNLSLPPRFILSRYLFDNFVQHLLLPSMMRTCQRDHENLHFDNVGFVGWYKEMGSKGSTYVIGMVYDKVGSNLVGYALSQLL